eukprot:COSAG06_NODE_948_length_11359_cov_6.236146_11_plen_78_part_00
MLLLLACTTTLTIALHIDSMWWCRPFHTIIPAMITEKVKNTPLLSTTQFPDKKTLNDHFAKTGSGHEYTYEGNSIII